MVQVQPVLPVQPVPQEAMQEAQGPPVEYPPAEPLAQGPQPPVVQAVQGLRPLAGWQARGPQPPVVQVVQVLRPLVAQAVQEPLAQQEPAKAVRVLPVRLAAMAEPVAQPKTTVVQAVPADRPATAMQATAGLPTVAPQPVLVGLAALVVVAAMRVVPVVLVARSPVVLAMVASATVAPAASVATSMSRQEPSTCPTS